MLLIVGLGNPGKEYEDTRHNAGFMLIDRVSSFFGIKFKRAGKALYGEGSIAGKEVILLKPQTFMNLSGEAVSEFKTKYLIEPESIIAAFDDVDLPLGKIRIRKGGGSGGQKGIKSMIEHLGSSDFRRIRLGIGRPDHGDIVAHVLSPFAPEEGEAVEEMMKRGAEALQTILAEGIDAAMNKFNS